MTADSSAPDAAGRATSRQPLSVAQPVYVSPAREFHVLGSVRSELGLNDTVFSLHGTLLTADPAAITALLTWLRDRTGTGADHAALVSAMLSHELLHLLLISLRRDGQFDPDGLTAELSADGRETELSALLTRFRQLFPPGAGGQGQLPRPELLEELLLVYLHNRNPAFEAVRPLLDDRPLQSNTVYVRLDSLFAAAVSGSGADSVDPRLLSALRELVRPQLSDPHSLAVQLSALQERLRESGTDLADAASRLQLLGDVLAEQKAPGGPVTAGSGGPPEERGELVALAAVGGAGPEAEWMRRTVITARNCLVWLDQLSWRHGRRISRLDQIPAAELSALSEAGITALWLIGIWQRSSASRLIKQLKGQADAVASAYSIHDYVIAPELGGEEALQRLRDQAAGYGLRLVADMVPNHTAIDSRWVAEHPDRFIQLEQPPFPSYTFSGPELSHTEGLSIRLEDHYWDGTDAAVVFERLETGTGQRRYLYHGNDGTGLPWNDTAQLDYLNPETREAVLETMVSVARQFSVIRFDAAMTLVSRHIQRLWYPPPGAGGAIASRALHGSLPASRFREKLPEEFWSAAVSRLRRDAPDTLLLAEAFWMLEDYFVQNLGLHRVYNSAFMHMLRDGANREFRQQLRDALSSAPEVLGRYVNFLSNPDEESAAAQFGTGDRYFVACTLLATMPGLPLIGHGQFEGLSEKYGMEFSRARLDEQPDEELLKRHAREIVPLLQRRELFGQTAGFELYDLREAAGTTSEDVIVFSQRHEGERALVAVNNSGAPVSGTVAESVPRLAPGSGPLRTLTLAQALDLEAEQGSHVTWTELPGGGTRVLPLAELRAGGLELKLGPYGRAVLLDFQVQATTATSRFDLLDPAVTYPDAAAAARQAAWWPLRDWLLALPDAPAELPPAAPVPLSAAAAARLADRASRLRLVWSAVPAAFPELDRDTTLWLLTQGIDEAEELLEHVAPDLPGLFLTLPVRHDPAWWRSRELSDWLQVHEAGGVHWYRQEPFDILAAVFALRGALRAGQAAGIELWEALQAAARFSGWRHERLLRTVAGRSGG